MTQEEEVGRAAKYKGKVNEFGRGPMRRRRAGGQAMARGLWSFVSGRRVTTPVLGVELHRLRGKPASVP